MKKQLLFITTCLFLNTYMIFSQSFTAGNIVVYRYGDGAAAMTPAAVVPCFLDEYTTSGTLVKSRAIPSTTIGDNIRLTGLGKLANGTYQQEGMSTLSQDKKYITIFGYNQVVGAGVPVTADGLTVGVVAADASYNSTTTLSSVTLGTPRSAIINGTDIWANGFQNGVQYTTLGGTSSTRVSVSQSAPRTLTIFNSNLYAPIGSSANLAQAALPTASTTFTTIAFVGTVPTTNQTAFFNVGGRVLMYVADDAANTIRRYYLNMAGTNWNLAGTTTIPSTTTEAGTTDFIKSITGIATVSGSNTNVDLYATTWGHDGNGSATSKLIKLTDTYLNSNPLAPASTSAITTLAEAPANTTFRSVTLAPEGSSAIGTGTLPIALNSFDGKKQDGSVQLNWATASEQNNAYFDILRSADGKNFQNIGQVKGLGSTTEGGKYGFTDLNPLSSVNYYQLNQVDFDGKSSKSKVIAVAFESKKIDFTVFADKNANVLSLAISADNTTSGDMTIVDMVGRVWLNQSVKLNKGDNALNIPIQLNDGIFVITLKTPTTVVSKKFIH